MATLQGMKKKSINFSHLSDASLTSTLANTHAMEKKEGVEMETRLSDPAKAKKPHKKYFTTHRLDASRQGEASDYSAYLENVEEGSETVKEGTLKSKSGLSRFLTLKGRHAKKEEEEEGEGSADGTGIVVTQHTLI